MTCKFCGRRVSLTNDAFTRVPQDNGDEHYHANCYVEMANIKAGMYEGIREALFGSKQPEQVQLPLAS